MTVALPVQEAQINESAEKRDVESPSADKFQLRNWKNKNRPTLIAPIEWQMVIGKYYRQQCK
jgi:hypothetical protein